MQSISINYTLKWQFKNFTHYKITTCKKVINCRTKKIKKACMNGGSIGYWIEGIFITKSKLNEHIELIEQNQKTPF